MSDRQRKASVDNDSEVSSVGQMVPLNSIHVPQQQSRRYFDSDKMAALVQSVQKQGILEPLLVRPLGNEEYELVCGERRYRAATAANLTKVPVVVKQLNDAEAVQVGLVENLQREDLNPYEETEGILQLLALETSLSVEEVISHLYRWYNEESGVLSGSRNSLIPQEVKEQIDEVFTYLGKMKWKSFVKNRLPLLTLPEDILQVLRSGEIEYTKAKAIASLKDAELRIALVKRAVSEKLSLRAIKKLINSNQSGSEPTDFEAKIENAVRQLQKAQKCNDSSKKEKLAEIMPQLEEMMTQIEMLLAE